MKSCEYVIIGAGFAGVATAYHLTQRGATDVLILEQEAIPGFHSSGRNAAMIRQCVSDAALSRLTRRGAGFLRHLPSDWPVPVEFKQNGSLLLGSGSGWERLQQDAELGRGQDLEAELWSPAKAKQRVPVLDGAEFDGAVWCGTDGVIDIHALLSGYLKSATARGAQIRYGSRLMAIERPQTGVLEVVTQRERIRTKVLINAAGAWANAIGQMANAATLPLHPCRRHLFVSRPLEWVDSRWPFVWDVTHDIYFRPEGHGLLICPCDQQELPPGEPPVDASMQEVLAEKIEDYVPGLQSVAISRAWAGFRTLSSDGRFVIGWDTTIDGMFWVAGLGGHGVTTSWAVGELAADLILAGPTEKVEPFSPARFLA